MKKVILFSFFLCILFNSCSPPVVGKMITKSYAPYETVFPVEVYYSKTEIPIQSESLGIVNVRDNGFSTNCDSTTVIGLIKGEARKVGGNAVYISEHIRPSFWGSTCHQMTGTLLKVGDFSQITDSTNSNIPTSDIADVRIMKPERKYPSMRLGINAGYGYRTAKLADGMDDAEKYYMKKLMSGLNLEAAFDYFISDYWGIGLMYSGYHAKADIWGTNELGQGGSYLTKTSINFIAPALLFRSPIGESFFLDIKFGIGYIGYGSKDSFLDDYYMKYNGASVGMHFGVGLEYKMTDNIGLFLNASSTTGAVRKFTVNENGYINTVELDDGQAEGLGNSSIGLGVRFHFK